MLSFPRAVLTENRRSNGLKTEPERVSFKLAVKYFFKFKFNFITQQKA